MNMTEEEVRGLFPWGGIGKWSFNVTAGLIGTAVVAVAVGNNLATTPVDVGIVALIAFMTVLAFVDAYLEAKALDERENVGVSR